MSDINAVVTVGLLLAAFVSLYLGSLNVRRRRTPLNLRTIHAYTILPPAMDETVESSRPAHFSFGASTIGGETTSAALASSVIFYNLWRRISFERRLPLVTLSDPLTLAIAGDTLRRAYAARGNQAAFRQNAAAWYPQGVGSMTFAAGAASAATDLDSAHHVLLGDFGAELAFLGETALRRDHGFIANSIRPEGQAVAFVFSPSPILGEELFVGGAYLDPTSPLQTGTLIAQDTLRWLVIVFGILLGIILNAVE